MQEGAVIVESIPFDNEVFQSLGRIKFVVDRMPSSLFAKFIASIALELFETGHELVEGNHRARRRASSLGQKWVWRNMKEAIFILFRPRLSLIPRFSRSRQP